MELFSISVSAVRNRGNAFNKDICIKRCFMFEKILIHAIRIWTNYITPEKEGCLKSVHIRRGPDNKIRKLVVYYPSDDKLPEYRVI